MEKWKPGNYRGEFHDDPRKELKARISTARLTGNDCCVSVPMELAHALVGIRECGSETIITGDEDGPLPKPATIRCRKLEDHTGMHYNGYASWDK